MTLITFTGDKAIIRDGKIGVDSSCCCEGTCDIKEASSGGAGTTVNSYLFPSSEQQLYFSGDAYSIPDQFILKFEGETVHDTGSISGTFGKCITKPAGVVNVEVTVIGPDGTAWIYSLECGCPTCDPPCPVCYECVYPYCVPTCDTGQYCCDGVCQDDPCGTECCCTDNVITEVNDSTDPCEGTTYAKPSAPDLSTISVVVEWCGITLTLNEANDWSAASGKQGIEGGETSCTQPGPYVIQVALAELNAGVGPTVVCNTVVFGLSADTYYWGNPGPGAVRFVGGISGPRCVVSSVIQTGGEGSWCPDGPCPDLPTFTVVGAP